MTAHSYKRLILNLLRQDQLDEAAFLRNLDESQRSAAGTPQLWSAKAHIAHRAFWTLDLVLNVRAILRGEEPAVRSESEDMVNARIFERQREQSWGQVQAESQRSYQELVRLVEELSDDDLNDTQRFAAVTDGHPLYAVILGVCYEHGQEHLAQYYSDHHQLEAAIEIREQCVERILQADPPLPDWVQASFLYNLASFYQEHGQLDYADVLLQRACQLSPELQEQVLRDPQLSQLRERTA
jgi:hypothetical protein